MLNINILSNFSDIKKIGNPNCRLPLTVAKLIVYCIKSHREFLHRYVDVADADLCIALRIMAFEGGKFYICIVPLLLWHGNSVFVFSILSIAQPLDKQGLLKTYIYSVSHWGLWNWWSAADVLPSIYCTKGYDIQGYLWKFRHFSGQYIYKQKSAALWHGSYLHYTARNTDTKIFPR